MTPLFNKPAFTEIVEEALTRLEDVPPLPEVAQRLLLLRGKDATLRELVAVIETDPALAAKIVSYARIPLFGYGDRIQSIEQAALLVLGYQKTLHLALGLAAGRRLRMPTGEPLGREAFWKKSLMVAIAAQQVATAMPANRPDPGLCYLGGLLHDIGLLVFGHLFPDEFTRLNGIVRELADFDLRELELQCFGISHDAIGARVLKAWNMPQEIIVAVSERHFPDYEGRHAGYAKLIAGALRLVEVTECGRHTPAVNMLAEYGLTERQQHAIVERLRGLDRELAGLARQMAA